MDRKAIQKELEQLPKEWVVAFAACCAAQCLPALLEKEKPADSWFAYWPDKKRDQYLFAVLRANSVAFSSFAITSASSSFTDSGVASLTISSASFAHASSYADSAHAAHAAHAASSFAAAHATTSSFAAVDGRPDIELFQHHVLLSVVKHAAHATFYAGRNGIDIAQQLALLRKARQEDKELADYLFQPLWQPEEDWYQRAQEFIKVLREIGSGFDFWADWYDDRLEGRAPDKDLLEAIVNLSKELLAQEPAQTNAYLKSLDHKADLAQGSLNRVRVIFLGYGATGKTSLIRVLNNQEVV
ncbi:MAG: hypothetical protein GY832_41335, partial [Chloroflexi bacterium]|nr:hypothetical protein [Chloroflexota bacterium]